MKKYVFLSAVLLLMTVTGCATSVCRHYAAAPEQKDSKGREVVAQIQGRNYGIFLFYAIPVWCGHGTRPNECEWDLWRNMVRPRDMKEMLAHRAKKLGAKRISDVRVVEKSSGFWSLWILWHRSVSGSAYAVEKSPAKKKR